MSGMHDLVQVGLFVGYLVAWGTVAGLTGLLFVLWRRS